MKKMLFLALFAALFASCAKEPQHVPSSDGTITQSMKIEVPDAQPDAAGDRAGQAYQFGLMNCTLSEYCFNIKVIDLNTNQLVWQQGGCYTGNTFYTVYLTPGTSYEADLVVIPAEPGLHGMIDWRLKNYGSNNICNSGKKKVEYGQLPTGNFWDACN